MRLYRQTVAVAVLALAVIGSYGCAEEGAPPGSDDDLTSAAVTSNVLGKVSAISLGGVVVGSRSKVTAVLDALGLDEKAAFPKDGQAPRPAECTYPLKFFGADGLLLARGGITCVSGEWEGNFFGHLVWNDRAYALWVDLAKIHREATKAPVMGDLLYAVKSARLAKGASQASTSSSADIRRLLAAVSQTITLRVGAEQAPSCTPTRTITFYRGDTQAARLGVGCKGATGAVTTLLYNQYDNYQGSVNVNVANVAAVENDLAWSSP